MFNLYGTIKNHPGVFRQFHCRETLISIFNCPLEKKFEDVWSHHNYIIYVIEGRKVWHTTHGSYDLKKGTCVFVRKGASIIEQFLDASFCLVMFFLPDEFITDVLKSKPFSKTIPDQPHRPVLPIEVTPMVNSFFHSMIAYFDSLQEPDQGLLELKFRELVLTVADNPHNKELLSFFGSLVQQPQAVSLQRIMEDNFCFNLKLEEFARLSNRSLSAFKRDFQRLYNTTPGKWLMEKRLDHALHLLTNLNHTVSEAAFESGFENPAHFSRSFRSRFGTSPAAIRQQIPV